MIRTGLVGICLVASACGAEAPTASDTSSPKYTLRYRFQPGETLRWKAVHRCQIRTSVSATTQTAETTTSSSKVWRVLEVKPDGTTVFEHRVEDVDMRHRLSGRDEVRYNSRTDPHPPAGFENVAQAVGVPLAVITINAQGKVMLRKQNRVKAAVAGQGEVTIPLPDEPVALGHRWSSPHDIEVPLPGGGCRRVQSLQTFKLLDVKTGVASIHVETQILTPLDDPALESQLLQYQSAGVVRFDIDAGRILGQQLDVDRGVVGFRGEASSIHYQARFTEEFSSAEPRIAARN